MFKTNSVSFWILVSILYSFFTIAVFSIFSYLLMIGWNMIELTKEITYRQSSGITIILFLLAFIFNSNQYTKKTNR